MQKYSNKPLQVRLFEFQENTLNKMLSDKEYMFQRGIFTKSDAVRHGLNNICRDYERENNIRSITT